MANERGTAAENEWSKQAWNANAEFWNARMGEGNEFFRILEWPVTAELLALKPGERVLDIACGNGLTSRRMAEMGAQVVACDFAEGMLRAARAGSKEYGDQIEYRAVDATNETELLALGERSFDAALCNMALFDMAEIRPVMRALARLVRPGGRFVFSVLHPAFNGPHAVMMVEQEELPEQIVTRYAVKVRRYLTPHTSTARAMRDQPAAQPIFHRPLQDLLAPAFEAGWVLDGLRETAYPAEMSSYSGSTPLSWGPNFSEIPPILIARLRLPTQFVNQADSPQSYL